MFLSTFIFLGLVGQIYPFPGQDRVKESYINYASSINKLNLDSLEKRRGGEIKCGTNKSETKHQKIS